MLEIVSAWLLTYWIHSVIALGLMWLLSLRLRERHLAFEEAGWRGALFLTLLTATLQLGLTHLVDWRPLAGSVEVPGLAARVVSQKPASKEAGSLMAPSDTSPEQSLRARNHVRTADPSLSASASLDRDVAVGITFAERRIDPVQLFFGFWLVGTAALLLRLALSCGLLARTLRQRTEVLEGPAADLLARLRSRASIPRFVALSVCRALLVPLALGLRRWEVCLPIKVAEEFEPEEQETVLAHELAHLVRRDTLWQLGSRVVSYVLFLQPLNFVALSRLQTLAELRCDDWAVERTGRPVTLAKCLTRVASWRSDAWGRLPLPAMASASRSRFGSRVRRLLARSYPQPQSRVPKWLRVLAAPAVIVFVAAAPGALQLPAPAGAPAEPVAPAQPPEPVTPAKLAGPAPRPTHVAPAAPAAPAAPPEITVSAAPTRLAAPHRAPAAVRVRTPVAPARSDSPPQPCGSEPVPAPSPVSSPAPSANPSPSAPPASWAASAPSPLAAPTVSPEVVAVPNGRVPELAARVSAVRVPGVFATEGGLHPTLAPAPFASSGTRALSVASASSVWSTPAPEASEASDSESDAAHWNAHDEEHHDEMDAFDEALEDELHALEDRIDEDFEVLEEELERELELAEDVAEEEFERLVEEFEDELDNGVEALEEDLEDLEEELEEREEARRDRGQRRSTERAVERLEQELERFESRHERELERLVEGFERSLERQWQRGLEGRFEEALARQEALVERRLEGAERQMEAAARRYEAARTPENRERLLAEVREQMRLAMPTEQELAAMRAAMGELRTKLAPRLEEARAARESLRPALEAWRARFAEELETLRHRQLEEIKRSE